MTELTRANVGNAGYGNNELILLYEITEQSIPGDYSRIHRQIILRCPVWISTSATYISVDGGQRVNVGSNWSKGDHVIWDDTITVWHDGAGNGNYTFTATMTSTYLLNGTASGAVPIPRIPRYANITAFNVSAVDEHSVKYSFSADSALDYAWYSIDNGAHWSDLPVNNIISGLNPGQTYNFKVRVRRSDSQLTTDSWTVNASPYDNPHCSETPDFTIGDDITIKLYNPLSRNVSIELIGDDNSLIYTDTTNGQSLTISTTETIEDLLYRSIPSSATGLYKVKVIYGSSERIRNNGNKYKVNESEVLPIFTDFEYLDSNSQIQQVVNNNQVLVDNNSTCRFVISSINKAVGNKYATITKYLCEYGNKSDELLYSDEDISIDINNSNGNILKVTAFDSRNLKTTIVKTIPNVTYVNAVINSAETQRENGVEAKTYLGGRFTIWKGNWQNGSNTDYDNRLKYVGYRVFDGTQWSEFYDVTDDVLEVIALYDNGTSYQLTFSPRDLVKIHENGESGGFTVGQSFIIQVLIKDGTKNATFTSNTYQAIFQAEISDGKVAKSLFKDEDGEYHEGTNGMPDKRFTSSIHGSINVKKLYIGGELFAWIDEDEE